MSIKRMTKDAIPMSFGAFKPVGHVVAAFGESQQSSQAAQALFDAGFQPDDVLHYSADEEAARLQQLFQHASGTSEFGHEIVLMRKYRELAEQGCDWLIVYAPQDERTELVADILRRHGALLAVKYNRLLVETLI